ncbi:hypothetical protein D3C81_1284560 [compost metagenome]
MKYLIVGPDLRPKIFRFFFKSSIAERKAKVVWGYIRQELLLKSMEESFKQIIIEKEGHVLPLQSIPSKEQSRSKIPTAF